MLSAGATQAGNALHPYKGKEGDKEIEKKLEAYKKQVKNEGLARGLFAERGVREWSWSSGL